MLNTSIDWSFGPIKRGSDRYEQKKHSHKFVSFSDIDTTWIHKDGIYHKQQDPFFWYFLSTKRIRLKCRKASIRITFSSTHEIYSFDYEKLWSWYIFRFSYIEIFQ